MRLDRGRDIPEDLRVRLRSRIGDLRAGASNAAGAARLVVVVSPQRATVRVLAA